MKRTPLKKTEELRSPPAKECPTCEGTGEEVDGVVCHVCAGTGRQG